MFVKLKVYSLFYLRNCTLNEKIYNFKTIIIYSVDTDNRYQLK